MSGVFAEHQPAYAEAGIATFPVDGTAKKPAVGNYLKAGMAASRQWACKFPEINALGFACGRRNGLTVLDIDAPDEGLLAEALDKFGPTPVIVQTASGKFHGWYRFDGEGRKIRPIPDKPIDILGGGFALAPPSHGTAGTYRFIQGSLADVGSLPAMRKAVSDPTVAVVAEGPVQAGNRNENLFRACLRSVGECSSETALIDFARRVNASGDFEPLPDGEVIRTAGSAWKMNAEGRNWVGQERKVIFSASDMQLMDDEPDAFILLARLRNVHDGLRSDFVVANAMSSTMPGGGWPEKRFARARARLEQLGYLRMVSPPRKGVGPAQYAFG